MEGSWGAAEVCHCGQGWSPAVSLGEAIGASAAQLQQETPKILKEPVPWGDFQEQQ